MPILSSQPNRRQCKDIYKPAPKSRYAILFCLTRTKNYRPFDSGNSSSNFNRAVTFILINS